MTPEQKQQRIEQILERQSLNLPAVERLNPEYAEAVRDIDFLLSLVKSQEAPIPCRNCWHVDLHNGPAGTVDDACTHDGCNCGYYEPASLADAATSMRSACVEKVRACAAIYAENDSEAGRWMSVTAADIITALESVSIQEQEAKQS